MNQQPAFLREFGRTPNLREAVALLRRKMGQQEACTASWHVPFDEFRDAAWILWNHWTPEEQRQYLRHVKGWYDAFRFRNPPQTESIVRAGVELGQLAFAAGHLRSARKISTGIEVGFDARRTGSRERFRAGAVINCTGPLPRPSASANPLWQSVLRSGVGRDSPCGVGIDVDRSCRLIDANGQPQPYLFAIGPPTIGRFAEAAAVPYIVREILLVVRHITTGPTNEAEA